MRRALQILLLAALALSAVSPSLVLAQPSQAVNGAQSTLASGIASGATSMTVATGEGARFPATSGGTYYLVIWNQTDYPAGFDDPAYEVVLVTAHTGGSDTFTITRAQQGTADSNHNTALKTYAVSMSWTASDFNAVRTALAGLTSASSPTFTGLTLSGLTAGRVPFATTGGQLTDTTDIRADTTTPNAPFRLRLSNATTAQNSISTEAHTARIVMKGLGAGQIQGVRRALYVQADDDSPVNKTITNAVNNGSGLVRITATGHGFTSGDGIGITNVGGVTAANGVWVVTVIDANTFDLQGTTFAGTYTSGGVATNRSPMVGLHVLLQPTLDRTSAGVGTNVFNDDLNGVTIQASGTGKATDGFYLAGNPGISGAPAWVNGFATDADSNYFFRAIGKAYSAGIDLASATYDGTAPAIALGPAGNILLDTATGTKIGTATSQKLGFFNATPVVQPAATSELKDGVLGALGLMATGSAANLDLDGGKLTAGRTITTDADGTVAGVDVTGSYTKNDSNTRAFSSLRIGPTLNFGGSNTNTTVDVLRLDPTVTSATGGTVYLARYFYGTENRYSFASNGTVEYSSTNGIVGWIRYEDSTSGVALQARKQRGSTTAPRRSLAGDAVMTFTTQSGTANDNTTNSTLQNVAQLQASALEDHSTTAQGTLMRMKTAPLGGTGLQDRYTVGLGKALTDNTAVSVLSMTLASNSSAGALIRYTIEATDGTDFQVETGTVVISAVNKAGAFTVAATEVNSQQSLSAGTMTTAWSISSANPAVISVNADTSLAPSGGYPRITFTVENLGRQAVSYP